MHAWEPDEGSVGRELCRLTDRQACTSGRTRCFASFFNSKFDAELIFPRPVFGRIKPSAQGVGKWLGYIDRFVIISVCLARRGGQHGHRASLRSRRRYVRC